jgi:hypothetical protein
MSFLKVTKQVMLMIIVLALPLVWIKFEILENKLLLYIIETLKCSLTFRQSVSSLRV